MAVTGNSAASTGHSVEVGAGAPSAPSRARTWIVGLDSVMIALAVVGVSAARSPGADGWVAVCVLFVAFGWWIGQARLYQSRFITRRADEVRRIVDAGIRAAATVALASYAFDLAVDRTWLAVTGLAATVGLVVGREVVRRRFASLRRSGRLRRRVLLIGDNIESQRFATMFDEEAALGYEVAEVIDPAGDDDPRQLTTRVLASARRHGAHGVVIAATAIDMRSSNRLIRDLVEAGIHVEISSTLADIASERLTVRPLGQFPVVYVEPRHRHGWRAGAKRVFDLTLAGTALVVLAPILAVVALAVRFDSKGPVLFRQERVGRHGEPFEVLKFRTMVVDAEALMAELAEANEGAGPLFKMKHDPRVTRVGRLLRKTSLDELPQLWNVVRNEMSLVGPRPALRSEMAEWSDDLYARLRVKPGITGMWQVSGRSSTTFEEYTRLDLYYVDNWSLVVDLAIVAKTIPAVLASDGAY